jgi:hypothetical protein
MFRTYGRKVNGCQGIPKLHSYKLRGHVHQHMPSSSSEQSRRENQESEISIHAQRINWGKFWFLFVMGPWPAGPNEEETALKEKMAVPSAAQLRPPGGAEAACFSLGKFSKQVRRECGHGAIQVALISCSSVLSSKSHHLR